MEINQVNFLRKDKHFYDILKGYFERFNAWKSVNKNLKTLLAVGGWVGEDFLDIGMLLMIVSMVGYGNERFRWYC